MTLKPCPFCSSIDVLPRFSGSYYFVQCTQCLARGPAIASFEEDDKYEKQKAIDLWNQFKNATKEKK
jgi:Lar family restriction alleviation protein